MSALNNQNFNIDDIDEEIKVQDSFFNVIKALPLITSILIVITGIALLIVFGDYVIDSDWWVKLLVFLGFIIVPLINFYIMKIVLSGVVLKIELLKKIAYNTTPNNNFAHSNTSPQTPKENFWKEFFDGCAAFIKKAYGLIFKGFAWLFNSIGIGLSWLVKGIWFVVKPIGKGIAWFFKKAWLVIKNIGIGIAWFFKKVWFVLMVCVFAGIIATTVILYFTLKFDLYILYFVLSGEIAVFGSIIALCCKNK